MIIVVGMDRYHRYVSEELRAVAEVCYARGRFVRGTKTVRVITADSADILYGLNRGEKCYTFEVNSRVREYCADRYCEHTDWASLRLMTEALTKYMYSDSKV